MWCFWLSYQFHHYNHHQWHEHLALDSHYHLVITKYKTNVITKKFFIRLFSSTYNETLWMLRILEVSFDAYDVWFKPLSHRTEFLSSVKYDFNFNKKNQAMYIFFLQLDDFYKYLKNHIPIGFSLLCICYNLSKYGRNF